ncbi:M14 family zinc carboxypeptidase [Turneriella parva]|uniref:Peptidase M14 carboxypeptidase A n=1 Tax=Turneriella parva (strain ATCC BAA-1111 / DSM 21527 / NCTC 11395 / H) TaxID=869212 RepID=I4BAL7_TURPD|nr:M14 family zinc carboxypeptidase [Turneriella parva]AFM14324.1 peptidase M14 carboxypeptidase A [Turneriella parva DSM 21527]
MSATSEILHFDRWERRLLRFVRRHEGLVRIRQLDFSTPTRHGQRWPIYMLEIGKPAAFRRHTVSLVSGVHGLETIAIRIHLDILKNMLNPKSAWYSERLLKGKFGINSIPILNPAGVAAETRANGRGVDLNRNSGIDAEAGSIPFFGGHHISPALPYYRGRALQRESRALFRFLSDYALKGRRQVHTAVDLHSGYGSQNYLWWPYSFSKKPVYQKAVFEDMGARLKARHADYRIEPMAASYQTHGDLWDRALIEFEAAQAKLSARKKSLFLPLTLEIGTWRELRKNPVRLLKKQNIFNPPEKSRKDYLRKHRQLLWDIVHLHGRRAARKAALKLHIG